VIDVIMMFCGVATMYSGPRDIAAGLLN